MKDEKMIVASSGVLHPESDFEPKPEARLDRPKLREEIAKKLCENDGHTWGLTSVPMMHKSCLDRADQLLALTDRYYAGKIEEAEKNKEEVK